MRTVAWFLVTLGGAVASWRWGGGPFLLAWIALCVAFAFTARKLTWSDAFRLWIIVLGFCALLIGGMIVLEARSGGFAAGVWLVICVTALLLLRKRLVRAVPILHLTKTFDEVVEAMEDLRRVAVDILTVGRYLQPTRKHMPIERYYTPDEFAELARLGEEMGFKWVESGPLVRSSYNAEAQARALSRN